MSVTPPLHPCARCAASRRTCCQRAEIVVTTGDVARIAAHTGLADPGVFVHRTRPTDPEYFEPDPDDPNWVRYTIVPDGTRRVLQKQDGANTGMSGHRGRAGDCTFLGPAGCVLPERVRPLVCRLYPFAYTERGLDGEGVPPEEPGGEAGGGGVGGVGEMPGLVRGVDESYCPTAMFFDVDRRAREASNLPPGSPRTTMLTVLRMDPRDAEQWRATLYAELRADVEEGRVR